MEITYRYSQSRKIAFASNVDENSKKIEILEVIIDDNEQYNRLSSLRIYRIRKLAERMWKMC
ncbi:hypothetical protein NQ314_018457 [Rhamnusium bicolor]|uniref:Uncharacterized protein n=1 Tax=Rhamnusium bicolor TaxID=1586634 RepID=A0AAV8WS03_9CUCU|nr:hypothetical protein NQ314_018457 [Rhamnusium bicolor]